MNRRIRCGILSAGRMAGVTMESLMAEHPAIEPVACFEIEPDRPDASVVLDAAGAAGVDRCGSFQELLGRDDLDLIVNVTPHYAHAETSIAALHAGRAVLCEKPPACTRDQLAAMIDAAERTGLPLLVHLQHWLRPGSRWLCERLRAGALGRIRRISCLSLWWRPPGYFARRDWAGRAYYRGRATFDGVMANQSIHYLNQMLALADRSDPAAVARPAELAAALYRFNAPDVVEVEDTAVVRGRLATDDEPEFVFAATTCCAEAAGPDRLSEYFGAAESHEVVIEGDRGRARWDGGARIDYADGASEQFEDHKGPWPFYFHLRDVLLGGAQPLTPIAESGKTMEFIFDAYDAAGAIRQGPWDGVDQLGTVLRRCVDRFALPAELATPPDWA
jgi:predicted dehydrogenase